MLYFAMSRLVTSKSASDDLRLENEELRRTVIERTEALLAARKDLSVLERMKRDFITLVSHELRTPITSVVGMADLIRNGIYDSAADLRLMATSIADEAARLSRFVDDLVEFLQWASGQMSTRMVPIDLPSLAQEAALRLSERYREKKVDVIFLGEKSLQIDADIQAIQSCLVRVIDNAIKFSKVGDVVEVRIDGVPSADPGDEGSALIFVRDHGEGISQEHLEDLYKVLTAGAFASKAPAWATAARRS
jgi:signal transduction histidine kinase